MTNDHRPISSLDDEALFAELRPGHRRADEAFGRLFFHYEGAITAFVRGKLGGLPDSDIEEVVQDVFLALQRAGVEGKTVKRVKPWLFGVASRKVVDYFRGSQYREFDTARTGTELDRTTDDGPAHEVEADGGQDTVDVWDVFGRVLDTRSPAHQAVIRGYLVRGDDATTVAAATGESTDNVYQVTRRFRVDLRAALNGHPPQHKPTTGPDS